MKRDDVLWALRMTAISPLHSCCTRIAWGRYSRRPGHFPWSHLGMRHNSSLIFSLQMKEASIRLSPWGEGTWRQVGQLRGFFITAIVGRINWFYKCVSESSILDPDKSFLNVICCHCLSNFIATSCPKGVYDSRLTGLTGIMESPSG